MPKVGVVTGAGRGIGHACAVRLAPTLDVLVLVDRDGELLRHAADAITCETVVVVADVADAAAIAALPSTIAHRGSLRAAVHAAGVATATGDWRHILDVDLGGTAAVVDALAPLVGDGAAMVCIASMAAQLVLAAADPAGDAVIDDPGSPDLADRLRAAVGPAAEDPAVAYAWAKRGVQRLVRREARRWGSVGGRICSVSPGIIDTPMGREEQANQPAMDQLVAMAPIPRFGRADEIAAVVAFLVSDDASFVTGTDVLVDGGVVAALS